MKRKISKFLVFLLIIEALFTYLPETTALAKTTGHSSTVIQPGINESGRYEISVIQDDNNWGLGLEAAGAGANVSTGLNYMAVLGKQEGSYSGIQFTKNTNYLDVYASDEKGSAKGDYKLSAGSNALFFSFPGHDASKGFDNDYDSTDYMRAQTVAETLGKSLNDLIDYFDALDGVRDLTADTLGEATVALSSGLVSPNNIGSTDASGFKEITVDIGGKPYYIYYGYMNGGTEGLHYSKNDANDVVLYAYVSNKSGEPTIDTAKDFQKVSWAQLKGYLAPCGAAAEQACRASWCGHNITDPDALNESNNNFKKGQAYVKANCSSTKIASTSSDWKNANDTTWITIWDIANYANYYYYAAKTNSETLANSEKPGLVESTFSNILLKFLGNIRSMLQLKSVVELVYQSNSNEITGGVMNFNWWSIMLKYHLIFQVLAWLIIGLALAKMILELNLSTINPQKRVDIIQQLEKLFVVGFLLALVVPIMRAMIEVNSVLVQIFATQAPTDDGTLFQTGNGLAGIAMAFMYLGIVMMINCTYIMRGIMIAIFGASAPLFIVTMLFSKGKGMFDNWLKEMAANIFLQSIHAFSFAFLSSVIKSGNWLAQLVIIYSLMPITEQFRNFIFGSAGGFTTSQGGKAAQAIHDTGVGAAKAATHAIGTGVNGIYSVAAKGVKADMENGGAKDSSSGGASGGRGGAGGPGGTGLTDTMKAHARNISKREDAGAATKFLGGAVKGAAMAMNGMSGIANAATQMTSGAMQIQQGSVGGAEKMNAAMMTAGDTVGRGVANLSSDISSSLKQREEDIGTNGQFTPASGNEKASLTYNKVNGAQKTIRGKRAEKLAAKAGLNNSGTGVSAAVKNQATSTNKDGNTLVDATAHYNRGTGTATAAIKGKAAQEAVYENSLKAYTANECQAYQQELVKNGAGEDAAWQAAYNKYYDGDGNVKDTVKQRFDKAIESNEGCDIGRGRVVYGSRNISGGIGNIEAISSTAEETHRNVASNRVTVDTTFAKNNIQKMAQQADSGIKDSYAKSRGRANQNNAVDEKVVNGVMATPANQERFQF